MVTLKELKELTDELLRLREAREKFELKLKKMDDEINKLDQITIPEAFMELGINEIKLDTGEKISYDKVYYANISEERSEKALAWLRANNRESLIKSVVSLKFGAALEEQVDKAVIENFLKEKEIGYDTKETVHPQTLKAFVKQAKEAGTEIPDELFGVFITNKTVVEEPKKSPGSK